MITMVPADVIDVVWDKVEPMLAKAVATTPDKFTTEDLYRQAAEGRLVIWVVIDEGEAQAVVATRLVVYPQRSALAIDWVGGSGLEKFKNDVIETIESYAVDCGCKHIEGYGSKAWGRILGGHGWEPEYIAYRKELADG